MFNRSRMLQFTLMVAIGAAVAAALFLPFTPINFQDWVPTVMPLVVLLYASVALGVAALLTLAWARGAHRALFIPLSVFFALCILLDRSFVQSQGWGLLFGSGTAFAAALPTLAGLSLVFYAMCRMAAGAVLRTLHHSAPATAPQRPYLRFAADMGILLACWLPYIILQAPGAMETTVGQQLQQAYGYLPYSQENPILHTLVIKVVVQGAQALGLSDTMAAMCLSLTQIIPLLAVLAWTVSLARQLHLPRTLVRLLLAYYALCPVFPFFSFFNVKDVPFAIALLLLTCELAALTLAREHYFSRPVHMLLHIGIGIYLCAMRNIALALYAAVVLLSIPLLRLPLKQAVRMALGTLAAMAVCVGLTAYCNSALSVRTLDNRLAENRSLPCQIVARTVQAHGDALSPLELATIDACIPLEGLAERYNPEVSDPVKDTWRASATAEQKQAFDQLALNLAKRYPGTAAQAFLQMAVPYLAMGDIGRFRAIYDYGFSNVEPVFAVFRPRQVFGGRAFRVVPEFFQRNPVVMFVSSSGFSASVLIGALALLLSRRRYRWLACALPAALTLLGCMFSPVAGYIRYALPFVFAAPFLAMVTIAALRTQTPPRARARRGTRR